MDSRELAKLTVQLAKGDCVDGRGRVFLEDINKTIEDKVSLEAVIQAIRETFPTYQTRNHGDNIIIVDFQRRSGE